MYVPLWLREEYLAENGSTQKIYKMSKGKGSMWLKRMPEEKKPIPFLFWILLNFIAWLLFWIFIQPIGAWLLYDRHYGMPFYMVIQRIGESIRWLPMGISLLAYHCFFPLSFYSWIFYTLLFLSYFIYRLMWKSRMKRKRSGK